MRRLNNSRNISADDEMIKTNKEWEIAWLQYDLENINGFFLVQNVLQNCTGIALVFLHGTGQ